MVYDVNKTVEQGQDKRKRSVYHRITEWSWLEETLKIIDPSIMCRDIFYLTRFLRVSSNFQHLHGWGAHKSGQPASVPHHLHS